MRCVVVGLAAALLSTAAFFEPAMAQRAAAALGMRAGPGSNFPVVAEVAETTSVHVHGCVEGYAWCDVSTETDRGWAPANLLNYHYENRDVLISEHGAKLQIPVVGFSFSAYWDAFYAERPWYQDRVRWKNKWRAEPDYLRYGRAERPDSPGGVVRGPNASAEQAARDWQERQELGLPPAALEDGRPAIERGATIGVQALDNPIGGAAGNGVAVPSSQPAPALTQPAADTDPGATGSIRRPTPGNAPPAAASGGMVPGVTTVPGTGSNGGSTGGGSGGSGGSSGGGS